MRQLFQPIAAFVYCNCQSAAGRRSRCKVQLNGLWTSPKGGVQLKLF